MLQTAEDILGHTDRRGRMNKWYDEECERTCRDRKETKMKWLCDRDDAQKKEEYRRSQRRAKRVIRRKKRLELDRKLRQIETKRWQNKRSIYDD